MGAGKTKLISKAIDYLRSDALADRLVYFYCNRNDNARRDPDNILRSFVKQLSMSPGKVSVHESVHRTYNQKRQSGFSSNHLTFAEAEQLTQEMIASYQRTTIVLDALDECDERERLKLIEALSRLVECGKNLKILVSSRENSDIKHQLQKKANIGISATDNHDDIRNFVMESIDRRQRQRQNPIPTDLQEEIANTILQKSDGMCVETRSFVREGSCAYHRWITGSSGRRCKSSSC